MPLCVRVSFHFPPMHLLNFDFLSSFWLPPLTSKTFPTILLFSLTFFLQCPQWHSKSKKKKKSAMRRINKQCWVRRHFDTLWSRSAINTWYYANIIWSTGSFHFSLHYQAWIKYFKRLAYFGRLISLSCSRVPSQIFKKDYILL